MLQAKLYKDMKALIQRHGIGTIFAHLAEAYGDLEEIRIAEEKAKTLKEKGNTLNGQEVSDKGKVAVVQLESTLRKMSTPEQTVIAKTGK